LCYLFQTLEYYETIPCDPSERNTGIDDNTVCSPRCIKTDCPEDCYADATGSEYPGCQCQELDWKDKYSGHGALMACCDPVFPYDRGWRAILLKGQRPKKKGSGDTEEVSGWVIYRAIGGGNGQFVADERLNILTEDIGANRAFFKQRYYEEEV